LQQLSFSATCKYITPKLLSIDPHVRTDYSYDGVLSIDEVISVCKQKGLDGVAILDHNTVEGALKLERKVPDDFVVIVGEEISTNEGEIAGLFLNESIPLGLSPEETIDKIKLQGGAVVITHPFCRFRKSRMRFETIRRIVEMVDIIEVFNSRNILNSDNQKAYEFAKEYHKLMTVGSDAHTAHEYGKSYLKVSSFCNAPEFKMNLSSAEFVTEKSPLWVHPFTKISKIIRKHFE
jgi:hypothetical protein